MKVIAAVGLLAVWAAVGFGFVSLLAWGAQR